MHLLWLLIVLGALCLPAVHPSNSIFRTVLTPSSPLAEFAFRLQQASGSSSLRRAAKLHTPRASGISRRGDQRTFPHGLQGSGLL